MYADYHVADTPIWAGMINNDQLNTKVRDKELHGYTRIEQLAILSIQDVINQSTVDLINPRCGLIFASTKGNIELIHGQSSLNKNNVSLWRMAEKVAHYFDRKDDFHIISNACISGLSALIVAQRWIQSGRYDQVVVTGADVLSHFITSGFISFKSVSRHICRPYDAGRDGLSLGEGCGTIVLSNKGSKNDVLLAGGGISNDANHLSGPSRTGDGLYLAMRQAMRESGLSSNDVDTVNAHGTATVYNDEMESKAIHLAELQHATVNSFKSYFGHTLGAAGVIETIISAHELKEQVVFGTFGLREPGISMPLNLSPKHENKPLRSCIKTASGFGGCNAAIALSMPTGYSQENTVSSPEQSTLTLKTSKTIIIENNRIVKDNDIIFQSEEKELSTFIRQAYKNVGGVNLKFYQSSDLCKLGSVAALYLLEGVSFEPGEMGIIMANAHSSLLTDTAHQHIIDTSGDMAASPAIFVYTLPNVVTGQICINHKIQGENTFFINKTCNLDELEDYASLVMKYTGLEYCIIGWCEVLRDEYRAELRLLEKKK